MPGGVPDGHLARAFSGRLDEVRAAALTGAFIGSISAALQVLLEKAATPDDQDAYRRALREATDLALAPWRCATDPGTAPQ